MASGEMSAEAFIAFLRQALTLHVAHSCNGALHYVCMDWRHIAELLAAGLGLYSELKNLCVWAKDNGGMGSLYRSHHELVFVHKVGRGEDRGSGTQLIQDLRAEGQLRPIALPASADKVTRMHTVSALLEAGHVLLPEQAAWLDDSRAELLQFPHGRHDDQADSLPQYLGWVRDRAARQQTWTPDQIWCGQPIAFARECQQMLGHTPSPWPGWESRSR